VAPKDSDAVADYVDVVAIADLPDQQMIATMIDGVRVAVAHIGQDFFAFGAVCTHEKANLDEGVLSEHQVYCPLHFSSFDVRTGEVLAPPAERCVPTYPVRVENGRVYVGSQPASPDGDAVSSSPLEVVESPSPEAVDSSPAETGRSTEVAAGRTAGGSESLSDPFGRTWRERLFRRLEESPLVGACNAAVTAKVSPLRRRVQGNVSGNVLLDLAHGSRWLGHAVHPMVSDVPIGLGLASVLVSVFEPGSGAERMLRVGTLLGGLGAAATGVVDWSVAEGRDRRLGMVHGVVNLGGLCLIGLAVIFDALDQPVSARVLGGLAVGVMGASAYLGGHLVFGGGVMVDRSAWTTGPRAWTTVATFDEIEDGSILAAQAGDREVVLYREGESVYALDGLCSHGGAKLALGKCEDGVITCPLHASQFRLKDGTIKRGPACFGQPVLRSRVVNGKVEVRDPVP